jgi:DNA-binding MurR/RpiR family transcriptional regulator
MSEGTATIADLIRARMDQLSPAERRVGRALLADYPSIGLHTIAGLADRAGVSGPTALRFAKRLGFDSFPAMQDGLRLELSSRGGGPAERFFPVAADTPAASALSAAGAIGQLAAASIRAIPQHDLDTAVELLANPTRTVYVSGGTSSGILAARLAELLSWIRPHVHLLHDPWHQDRGSLIDLRKRDVYVLFDIRRYQRDSVELAALVRDKDAALIVFTDEWLSPAARHADAVLATSSRSPSPFETLTSALMLVEALVVPISAATGARARARMRDWEALDRKDKVEPSWSPTNPIPEAGR